MGASEFRSPLEYPSLTPAYAKNSLKTLFWGSRSFKVIDVNKFKHPIAGACYDIQHHVPYLQPFSHNTR